MNRIVGRTITRLQLEPFPDGRGGTAYTPSITLDDGSFLTFSVQETESMYGIGVWLHTTEPRKHALCLEHDETSPRETQLAVGMGPKPPVVFVRRCGAGWVGTGQPLPDLSKSPGFAIDLCPKSEPPTRTGAEFVADVERDLQLALKLLEDNLYAGDNGNTCVCCEGWRSHDDGCEALLLLRKHGRKVDP